MARGSKRKRQVALTLSATTGNTGARKRKQRPAKRRRLTAPLGAPVIAQAYCESLNNPWEFQGPKLGFGCLVPSYQATGYGRYGFTVSATGTITAVLSPSATSTLTLSTAGYSDPLNTAFTTFSVQNRIGLQSNYSEARVVSGGIRAFVNQPATSQPGVAYVGRIPSSSLTGVLAATPQQISNYPMMEMFPSVAGVQATFRPVDTESFEFAPKTLLGFDSGDVTNIDHLLISIGGLPVGATVFLEVALNLECLPTTATTATTGQPSPDNVPVASDFWPNVESLVKSATHAIGNGISSMSQALPGFSNVANSLLRNWANYNQYAAGIGQGFLPAAGAAAALYGGNRVRHRLMP